MKKTRLLSALFLSWPARPDSLARDLPKTIDSPACKTAPTIDGVIQPAEWREATLHRFDLSMVRSIRRQARRVPASCE